MVLAKGAKVGPYEVLSPLGAGGMGEVYRARDVKLGREVAIKVVPAEVAHDAERMARFQREAQVLAALNHPHIGAIYGLEEADGIKALILELVEGPTIADRIAQGPIPMDETLQIARQMAEALEAAHEKGIVHRDLKPANVKLTRDDQVKVLDFGLAKALSGDASSPSVVDSPTVTVQHTRPGVILGTAAYMSPEQARGKAVDKRTDIWSFGCVLFEMLTGARPFEGETTTDVIGAILHKEPDFGALPQQTPPTIQLLLRRCLSKDRNKRIRDIGDARIEIDNAITDPTSSFLRSPSAVMEQNRLPALRQAIPWVLCLILAVSLAAVLQSSRNATHSHVSPVTCLSIPTPTSPPRFGNVAISPDGRYIVYQAIRTDAAASLYLRPMDGYEERALGDSGLAFAPFISPDGQGIGFFTDQDLRVVSASGASSQRVCEAFGYVTGAWGPDGTIVFSAGRSGDDALPGLSRVPATGGVPEVLTTVDPSKNERAHVMPEFLPDGKHVLFAIETDTAQRVAVLSLETREYRILLEDASQPHYAPTGHLVFYDFYSLKVFAVPFDPVTLRVTDQRVQVLGDLTRAAVFSQNGTLAYMPIRNDLGNAVVCVDREGKETPLVDQPGSWVEPRFSPDGRKLILRQTQAPYCFLWLNDLERSTLTRLTFDGDSHGPTWSGDGRYAVFGLEKDAMRSLYRMAADGGTPPERIWKGAGPEYPGRGTADGLLIPFEEENSQKNTDIWVLSMQGEPKAEPFLKTPFREGSPAFSPDGKWIAYTSDESGRDEVYVRPYPGPGGKIQVSTDGGSGPLWSKDGKELFYVRRDMMMAVELTSGPTFTAAAPRKLFDGPYAWDRTLNYDISPDGQRFVIIKPRRDAGSLREIRVVLNWFEELKAKVPAGTK